MFPYKDDNPTVTSLIWLVFQGRGAEPRLSESVCELGVIPARLVLYPRVMVHTIIFFGFFITRVRLPAYFMLLFWAAIQFMGSLPSLAGVQTGGGVAFMAHLSGFIVGAVLIKVFSKPDLLAAARRQAPVFATRQPWRY